MNDKIKNSLKEEIGLLNKESKGLTLYGLKRSDENCYTCSLKFEISGEFLLTAEGINETLVSIKYLDGQCIVEGLVSDREIIPSAIIKADESAFMKSYLEQIESLSIDLEKVITNPTFIVGPPGTGKTNTICEIVSKSIKNKEKVLIVSPTNMAVENVFERLDIDKLGLKENEIVLNVKTDNESLQAYSPKSIAEEKINQIQDELDVLDFGKQDCLKEIRDLETLVSEECSTYDSKETLLKNLENDKLLIIGQRNKVASEIKSLNKRIDALGSNSLVKAVANAFMSKKVNELNREMEDKTGSFDEFTFQINTLESKIDLLVVKKEESSKTLDELRTKLNALRQTKKEIEDRQKLLKDELENIISFNVFENARLVGATLVGAALNKKIRDGEFDKIIVDEASMALMPTLLLSSLSVKAWDDKRKPIKEQSFSGFYEAQQKAINMALNSQFVFVGDPKQLSAIATTKEMRETIFEKYNISRIFNREEVHNAVLLDINFRCHPEITELCSKMFYGGLLKSGREHTGKKALYIRKSISPMYSDKKSYANAGNMEKVLEQTQNALSRGKRSLGVISPFRAQASLINENLDALRYEYPDADLQAGTVHKFQGKEKNIVVFDITYSTQGGNGFIPRTFLGNLESEAARLLNVAMTRAEDFFVLVGDVDNSATC